MAISNNLSVWPIRISVAAHLANLAAAQAPSDTLENVESLPEKLFRPLPFVQFAHFCARAFRILRPITHVRAPFRDCHCRTICYCNRAASSTWARATRCHQALCPAQVRWFENTLLEVLKILEATENWKFWQLNYHRMRKCKSLRKSHVRCCSLVD